MHCKYSMYSLMINGDVHSNISGTSILEIISILELFTVYTPVNMQSNYIYSYIQMNNVGIQSNIPFL